MIGAIWARIRPGLVAAVRGTCLYVLAQALSLALFILLVVTVALTVVGVGLLATPVVTVAVHAYANLRRRLARDWAGVEIPVPYRPRPTGSRWRIWHWFGWAVDDPATWRDLAFLLIDIPASLVLGLVPACVVVYGLEGITLVPVIQWAASGRWGYGMIWPFHNVFEALLCVPLGALFLAAGLPMSRHGLRLHAHLSRWLLAPTRAASLSLRVRHLSQTRAETLDTQAAELRRIERDLHDGAQARLAALSMNIGLAEELMKTDPDAAQDLLTQARLSSGKALAELRDLVRGIHPPVLAERGLDGAVRALALAVPIPVEVTVDLPERLPAPIESAAYFALAEVLANVTKHSRAEHAWVRAEQSATTLCMVVRDDGVGGTDPGGGTGLRGIARRLAAFDGTITITSPPGGPTVVRIQLPYVAGPG